MDVLERYLQAIGQFFPEQAREDTLAELRANLLEQMDARAEELGRPLADGDVAAVLWAHGKPELVALRYLPQRSLIGPAMFPFYEFTLSRALPLVVFVYALTRGIVMVVGPHGSVARELTSFAFGLIPVLLLFWAVVTVIFAVIERARERGQLGAQWNEWDPMKLPAVKAHPEIPTPRSMAKRVIELALHCLWMAYVLWVPWHPFWILGPGVFYFGSLGVTLAPAWHAFYVLLITLLTVQLAMKLLAFVPAATAWMRPLKIATDLLGVAALAWMAWTSTYFAAAAADADLQKITAVNHAMSLAFRIAVVCALAGMLMDGWKYARRWVPTERLAF